MIYFCCDKLRRNQVRGGPLNGIDFIEVVDLEAAIEADRQRFLHVHLLNDPGAIVYTADNIEISGDGAAVEISSVTMGLLGQTNVVVVEVDSPGDFSQYCLSFVRSLIDLNPPVEFDPILADVTFSFKVECPSPFDCVTQCDCPDEEVEAPNINYLARDFSSFRDLMVDRMAQVAPQFKENNAADLSVVLLEILAYVADRLAWKQDTVQAEGYLNRLRSRISARRLARLVDYSIDEGANSRCFCHIQVSADLLPVAPDFLPVVPKGSAITTLIEKAPVYFIRNEEMLDQAKVVFETMQDTLNLFSAHNEMLLYTWSNRRCSLPKGATRATLTGHFPNLLAGSFVAFEEIVGPTTGNSADKNIQNRQVVKLTEVIAWDEFGDALTDPVTGEEITHVIWGIQDSLQFPVCISAETDIEFGRRYVSSVSVVRGNILLVDHGRSYSDEVIGTVPQAKLGWASGKGPSKGFSVKSCEDELCEKEAPQFIDARFRPQLKQAPLTFAADFNENSSARLLIKQEPGTESAQISLNGNDGASQLFYYSVKDLLASTAFSLVFTTEVERDGEVFIRFGDGIHGRKPITGTEFSASYRVGNGKRGNIGADKLRHIALDIPEITQVRNITSAVGGRDRETITELRQKAPFAYRQQERAVTRKDHADLGKRLSWIQDISTSFVHTGSWMTSFIVADPIDRLGLSDEVEQELKNYYEVFRMAARDLEVESPNYVPLEITLRICVNSKSLRSPVFKQLQAIFSSSKISNGLLGFFHPDNFSFGETLHLSPIIAAAQKVEGVSSVVATRFRRLGDPRTSGLTSRKLKFGRSEIPRVDNDLSNQGNGIMQFELVGGR